MQIKAEAQYFVGPDLGPNSLQRLLAGDKNPQQQAKLNFYP